MIPSLREKESQKSAPVHGTGWRVFLFLFDESLGSEEEGIKKWRSYWYHWLNCPSPAASPDLLGMILGFHPHNKWWVDKGENVTHAVRTDFPTRMFSDISSRYIVIVAPSLASENCLNLYSRALLPMSSLPLCALIWKGCEGTQRALNSKASQKDICSLPGRAQVASPGFIDEWNNENALISSTDSL